jgi:hypothetical protein
MPGPSNTFVFSPPILLPSTGTLTFTVTATLATNNAKVAPLLLRGGVAYAGTAPGGSRLNPSRMVPWSPLMLAGLAGLVFGWRSRRWIVVGGALILVLMAVGCGGGHSSSGSSGPSSSESVSSATTVGPQTGLPLTIAVVSTQ